jgi:5-methylthioadenosine/S-adenosylhomocysteine deaminase
MIMGGEVYLGAPTYTQSWTIGRQLDLQIAAHILSPFGIRPILDLLAQGQGGVSKNILHLRVPQSTAYAVTRQVDWFG